MLAIEIAHRAEFRHLPQQRREMADTEDRGEADDRNGGHRGHSGVGAERPGLERAFVHRQARALPLALVLAVAGRPCARTSLGAGAARSGPAPGW